MIRIFNGKNRFLSNFYFHDGWCVEIPFQAAKTHDNTKQARILLAKSPAEAKKLGRSVVLRPDWEDVKEEIMLKLLRLKFKIPKMRRMLLDTGHQELEEGNYWHDNEWGNCYCMKCLTIPGKNKLGKLLMKIRDELLTEDVQAVPEKLELEEAKRIIDESLDPEFYRKEIVDDNS